MFDDTPRTSPIMMPFTQEEIAFLKRHDIKPDDVHDGRSQLRSTWQMQAKEGGKMLVMASPCRAEGHRLKTRSGHCFQCDPKKIAYQNRHSSSGYVYIAGSLSGRIIKVGTAVDIDQRQSNLRNQKYGGLADWVIVFHMKVSEGGRVERDALRRLRNYKVTRQYEEDGLAQEAGEILRCSFGVALKAIADSIGDDQRSDVWRSERHRDYEFK
jgi:hypothetical protein